MTQKAIPRSLVLDTEALSSLASRRNRPILARLQVAAREGTIALFPTVVLAELLTGGSSDAKIWQVVNKLISVDATIQIAAHAGQLREKAEKARKKKRDLTVDAIVASTAILWAPSILITSDVEDLRLLTEGYDVKVVAV